MDEEIKKICEEYAWAWYFDHSHRLEWQNKYFQLRKKLSIEEKEVMTDYFCKCQAENEKSLPSIDYLGPFESYCVN